VAAGPISHREIGRKPSGRVWFRSKENGHIGGPMGFPSETKFSLAAVSACENVAKIFIDPFRM